MKIGNFTTWSKARVEKISPKDLLVDLRTFLKSTPRVAKPEQLRGQLVILLLLRVVVVSAYLGISTSQIRFNVIPQSGAQTFTWLFAALFVMSLANLLLLRATSHLVAVGYVQLSLDVVFATIGVYATGSTAALSLYILVIAGAALVFSAHGAAVIAALSGICYAALVSGIFPSLVGFETGISQLDILSLYVALVAIGLVSVRFTKQLEKVTSYAGDTQRNLDTVIGQQKVILDDISDGIITINLTEAITNINKAARAILALTDDEAVSLTGRSLEDTLRIYGINEPRNLITSKGESPTSKDVTISLPNNTGARHLTYTVRPLSDSEGHDTGKILIFNDISHLRDIKEKLNMHEHMAKLLAQGDQTLGVGAFADTECPIIGESSMMQRVYGLVERVSASDASVLITGESGTGKELVARAIHQLGRRRNQAFVAINCGAIPENLIESELFGHKKGSFTGAVNEHIGLFRRAHGGTIFLDEIGELPLQLQAKLLRVLQEKRVRAVGDTRDVEIDVRVIAATNRDLRREIQEGRFREDLFYRLNVVNIFVPPLRDRREDIPLLVRYFIAKHCGPDSVLPQISPDSLELLMSYSYPGNIRELENIIERALVLGGQAILPEHLPEEVSLDSVEPSSSRNIAGKETDITELPMRLEELLESVEKRYLLRALDASGGVKKQAAELLGLNFRSFRYRLKKYSLEEADLDEIDDNTK